MALVEYHDGEMYIFRSTEEEPWQLGTNFPVVLTEGNPEGNCWRYDAIAQSLAEENGRLCVHDTMNQLEQVSTPTTQWSMSYDLAERIIYLAVGRDYDEVYRISLQSGYVGPQRRWGHQ